MQIDRQPRVDDGTSRIDFGRLASGAFAIKVEQGSERVVLVMSGPEMLELGNWATHLAMTGRLAEQAKETPRVLVPNGVVAAGGRS